MHRKKQEPFRATLTVWNTFWLHRTLQRKKQKRAVLLHLAGVEVQTIFETLSDTGTDYDAALAKLTEYFESKKNIVLRTVFLVDCCAI